MQDKGSVSREPLAKFRTFGTPFHGLVKNGLLTLPNATTRAYSQPSNSQLDEAGSTWLFSRPGMPEIAPTIEDTDAGYSWRNTAILAGARQQYAGRDLEGWIYVSPSGERWLIQPGFGVGNVYSFSGSISLGFTAKRFGEIGGIADTRTFTRTLSDWGQQGYDSLAGYAGTLTSARLAVTAVQPNGSAAAVMVYERQETAGGRQDQSIKHPLGWLQVTVSGEGATLDVQISVLRNRGQTLVVVENEWTDTTVVRDDDVPGTGWTIRNSEGVKSYSVEMHRIVAMWPGSGGSWVEVLHAVTDVGEASLAVTVSTGVSITRNRVGTLTHFIRVGGVDQVSFAITTERELLDVYSANANPLFIDRNFDWSGTVSEPSGALPFGETGSLTIDPSFEPSAPIYDLRNRIFADNVRPNLYDFGVAELPSFIFKLGHFATMPTFVQASWAHPDLINLGRWDFCRYSGQVFGFRYIRQAGSAPFPAIRTERATPSGAVGAVVSTTDSASERLYSSWCPQTNQTAPLDTVPVCWV